MPGNYARLGVGVKDEASGPLDRIRDKFSQIQKQGAKGFAIGVGAKATEKGIGMVSSALHGLGDAVGDAINDASNLSESMSKNEAVFRDHADEMEDWAAGASKAFGQSKRSALEAAGTFGNLIQAFGIGDTKAAKMSKTLTELASDLASFNNTSVDEAILALRSGLSGETEPLKRYGVALSDVRLKEEALRLGLIETAKGVLPVAIKTQAAYSLILKDTALAQGDFARTSDGMANQMRILEAQAEDTSAKFGQVLLPVVVEFQETVINAMDRTGMSIENVADAARNGSQAAQAHFNAMGGDAEVLGRRVEFMADASKDDMAGVGAAAGDMAGEIGDATDDVEQSWEDMVDKLTKDVERMIDEVHDPAIIRADIAANAEEDAALRKIIASKDSTDAEIKDAKRRRLEVAKEADELRFELFETGNMTAKETDKWLADLEEDYEESTGSARAQIGKLIAKIKELRKEAAKGITVNAFTGFVTSSSGGIPGFADGAHPVPGPEGKPMLAVVHGGEDITSVAEKQSGAMGGNTYVLNVMGNLVAPNEAAVLQTMRRLESVAKPMAVGA